MRLTSMIEVRFLVVLTNTEGWDPSLDRAMLPEYYKPGRPLPTPSYKTLKVLAERDFTDKFLIYREAMSVYLEAFWALRHLLPVKNVEFVYKPVSEGDYRGVVVVVLENMDILRIPKLTKVDIPSDLWDVEQDQARKQPRTDVKVIIKGTLPRVPDSLPPPTSDDVISVSTRFAEATPEEAGAVAGEMANIAAVYWQNDPRYILTASPAEKITGLSRPMLTKLANDEKKRLAEFRDKQWYFSGTGLAHYLRHSRGKPGRKPATPAIKQSGEDFENPEADP